MLQLNNTTNGLFNYKPETAENSVLAAYEIGSIVHKTVRVIMRIYKGDNGFAIYNVEEDARNFVILGNFPYDLILNSYYNISGEIVVSKKNEKQIKVHSCTVAQPTDREGILTVLRTLHGLDTQAYKLYSIVGPDVLDVIQNDPQKIVAMVKGVGIKRAKAWQSELLARGENDRELQKLCSLGLTSKQAIKLVTENGISICEEISNNPYLLIGKIKGFTFKKCDKIAIEKGLSIYNLDRIRQGILYVVKSVENKGHSTYPKDIFMKVVHNLLDVTLGQRTAAQIIKNGLASVKFGEKTYSIDVNDLQTQLNCWKQKVHKQDEQFVYIIEQIDNALISQALFDLQTGGSIIVETFNNTEYITSGLFYRAENIIVSAVRDFVANERLPFRSVEAVIDDTLENMGVELEKMQLEAVRRICKAQGGIFILNGSAGSGKTFTLNIIMEVLRRLYEQEKCGEFSPCILAPTGKAAKVAALSTKLPAQTIHRKLGIISDDGLSVGREDIHNNCIVVDEVSMVDEVLCSQLFQGVPKAAKIILLGDTKQLPSIRAGCILKDLIECGKIPVISLNVVKRQDAQSGILVNANKIANGEYIDSVVVNQESVKNNAYIDWCDDAFLAQESIVKTAQGYGLRAFQDDKVQVLTPLKLGAAGTVTLNYLLQQVLNPASDKKTEVPFGRINVQAYGKPEESVIVSYRVGDCVINIRNNYNQPWYKKHLVNGFLETDKSGVVNGDTGVIDTISIYKDSNGMTHRVIYVKYDDHYIAYDNDYDELALAYALTIHKSQGSQWPIVICPIIQPTMLLNRKLLYTMYTRAQETNILIGKREYVNRGIKNDQEEKRLTLLKERLNVSR